MAAKNKPFEVFVTCVTVRVLTVKAASPGEACEQILRKGVPRRARIIDDRIASISAGEPTP